MKRLFQRATGSLGKEDTKTVQIKYNRINEEEVRQYRHDTNRNKLNKKLQQDACRAVLDYLKFHKENVSPPLPSLEKDKLAHSVFTANFELLDKLAYASLKSYSYTLNGSAPQKKIPPTNITKLSSLVGGKWVPSKLTMIGSWDDQNSEIGNDAVTVTFEFDFSKVHENNDLKEWQARENLRLNPKKPTLVRIVSASPNFFQLENGEVFTDMKPYETRIYDKKGEWDYYSGALGPPGNTFLDPDYVKKLESSYLDMDQINKVKEEKRRLEEENQRSSGPDAGPSQQELYYNNGWDRNGGKSKRRHRSNTHRRIKQKKRKTKKNNSRRRKNTRK